MKIDKYVKTLCDKVDNLSNNNGNGHHHHTEEIIIYDDDYYIEIGSEPPRFLAYRQARAKKWALEVEAREHKPSDYDPSVTQDELDFSLELLCRDFFWANVFCS